MIQIYEKMRCMFQGVGYRGDQKHLDPGYMLAAGRIELCDLFVSKML